MEPLDLFWPHRGAAGRSDRPWLTEPTPLDRKNSGHEAGKQKRSGDGWSSSAVCCCLPAAARPPPEVAGSGRPRRLLQARQPLSDRRALVLSGYDPSYAAVGIASWYGHPFHGRATANGELFDRDQLSAAHPTLPLPSIVRVTNLANQRQLELRVNDRGPFVGDRIIDLSQAAARALGFERQRHHPGPGRVRRPGRCPGMPPQPTAPQPVAAAAQAVPAVAPSRSRFAAGPCGRAAPRCARRQPVCWPSRRRSHGQALPSASSRSAPSSRPSVPSRLAKELDAAVALPVSADLPSVDRYARVRLGPIADPRAGRGGAALAASDRLRKRFSGQAGCRVLGLLLIARATAQRDGGTSRRSRLRNLRSRGIDAEQALVGRPPGLRAARHAGDRLGARPRLRRTRPWRGRRSWSTTTPVRSCTPRTPTSRCRRPR